MRIQTEGFEGGSLDMTSLNLVQYVSSLSLVTGRKDIYGNGGDYALQHTNAAATVQLDQFDESTISGVTPEEITARFACELLMPNNQASLVFTLGGSNQFAIRYEPASSDTAVIQLRRGWHGGTVLATSSGSVDELVWHYIQIEALVDDSSGYIKVYKDGGDTPFVEYSGDTQDLGSAGVDGWYIAGGDIRVDDIAVNTPTMLYDGDTGSTGVNGETITGGTSGATATIVGDQEAGTAGRLWLREVSGTFIDGEAITGDTAFAAVVNAPTADFVDGLEPNSTTPGNGYIVGIRPNGDDTIGLTGSDGDSINNYLLVDETGSDTADYVVGTTNGDEDLYTNQSLTDIGLTSGQIDGITAISLLSLAESDGTTIPNMAHVVKLGATTDRSDPILLPSSWGGVQKNWSYNPDTNQVFTYTDIGNLITGIQFQS